MRSAEGDSAPYELAWSPDSSAIAFSGKRGPATANEPWVAMTVYPHILLDSFQVSATPVDDPGKTEVKPNYTGFTESTRFTFSIPIQYEAEGAQP